MLKKCHWVTVALVLACVPAFATVDSLKLKLSNGTDVLEIFESGDAIAYGTVTQSANPSTELIQDSGTLELIVQGVSNILLRANGANGVVYLKGTVQENQTTFSPSGTDGELILKNSAGDIVAMLDASGNLLLAGELVELDLL